LLAAPKKYPGWDVKLADQGGSKSSNGFPDDKVETLVHLKERRGDIFMQQFSNDKFNMFELSLKDW